MTYLFSTLNLYFCRVFTMWLGICTLVISAVISLFEGTELARRSIGKSNIDFSLILEMILLKFPNHFQVLMPFIVLSAAMVTFYRLNHTHEIIAARSSGLSVWQLLTGLGLCTFLLGCFQLIIINPVGAAMSSRLENLEAIYFSGSNNRIAISETGLWLREATPDRQSIIRTAHVKPDTKTFRDVTFHNFRPSTDQNQNNYENRIDASVAILQKDHWELHNATIWQDDKERSRAYPILTLPTALTIAKIQDSNTAPETISFWTLPNFIDILDRSGLSSLSYRLYWHAQIAKLGMMIAMLLLAAAFGIRPVRQGKTALYIVYGLGSGFVLYFLNDIVYALGLGDQLPVFLAAWAPTLIMMFLSTALLLHNEDG
jgi:lipopolysaccharide export system permease protein